MQYPVPQFQDVEDKIIGPLTFKQFIYILGGGGLSYAILQSVPTGLNYLLIAPIIGLSLALSFYKINNQPLINIIEYAFYYSLRNKLYLWSHKRTIKKAVDVRDVPTSQVEVPNINDSKMKDLAWSLDINENVSRAEHAKKITEQNVLNSI
ncbi:MAG: PrgI family protein [Candidatus Pacebacteria bacterium]|nr:PrgI family protein [Candidatus Paceibacterota bacterium]